MDLDGERHLGIACRGGAAVAGDDGDAERLA